MKIVLIITILILGFSSGYSQVKDSASSGKLVAPWWVEKFRLSAGFFESINNTKVRVSVNGSSNGTETDFQKDLGLGANLATFQTNFQWRLSRRSRFSFGYFDMKRSAVHT